MASNPVWEICERVAEVQALLDDHIAGGKHWAASRAVGTGAVAGRCSTSANSRRTRHQH
jgi:hypothetical protein